MVAYLNKSDASKGFNQVIDFLNGSYIKLQDLVNKKKVVITKAAIKEVLRLNDAEGVDCLPNEDIFAELARMGYEKPSTKLTFYKAFFSSQWKFLIHIILQSMSAKRTSWNEFSSAMAFAVICLSTGRKFNFSKEDTAAYGEVLTVSQEPSIPTPTPPTPPPQPPQDLPSTSQVHHNPPQSPQALEIKKLKRRVKKLEKGNWVKVLKLQRLKRVGTSQRVDTSEDTVMDDASNQGRIIDELDRDDVFALMGDKEEDKKEEEAKEDEPAEVHEVVDVVTTAKLITKVVTPASKTITTASTTISAAEPQVLTATITAAPAKDKGKKIMVEEPKPLKKKQQVKMDEKYARKLHVELNKDFDWDAAIDHVKQKAKEDPSVQRYQVMKRKPQTEAHARKNMIVYLKNVSINETPAQKAAKRRKLNEEVEDLKRHLEIVPDEDDDVYTEAIPLARKIDRLKSGEIKELSAAKQKLMLLDSTAEGRLMLLSQVKTVNDNIQHGSSKQSLEHRPGLTTYKGPTRGFMILLQLFGRMGNPTHIHNHGFPFPLTPQLHRSLILNSSTRQQLLPARSQHDQGQLEAAEQCDQWVRRLRWELDEVQRALDKNPFSATLREEEAVYLNTFTQATLDEERYLKQKEKIEWHRVNSGYFHSYVKAKRGEYSQWVERFMNYLEEQTDGEAMINSIKNGDQPLPRVTQVSIAGTSSTEQPPLKDKSMCNKTAKDLSDALGRHMLGSEYDSEGSEEDDFSELKKITALLAKDFNRRKFYSKPTNNNLRTSSTSQVKCYNCKKEGHFVKDCKKVKVKDYEYYKTKMLLAKKDKDEQVLLAEDQAWMESSSDSDQEINANMVFMAQIEKVLSDS
nr:RNA-directed DNA polymerase, eukaryota, reverse transcriptase zinc-binding domain protein [Tanacetum cinerariifolium]